MNIIIDIISAHRYRGMLPSRRGNGPFLDFYMVDLWKFGTKVYEDGIAFALGWFRFGFGWYWYPIQSDRFVYIGKRRFKRRQEHKSLLEKEDWKPLSFKTTL